MTPLAKSPAGLALLAAPLLALAAAPAAERLHAPYPDGFLQWKQVKTTTLDPKDPATAKRTDAHFVYANEQALEGLRTGLYPADAEFVLEIFRLNKKDGVVTLGPRDSTSSMRRDARATDTGGWIFEDFDVVTRAPLKMDAVKDCYQCHTQREQQGYVFTKLKS